MIRTRVVGDSTEIESMGRELDRVNARSARKCPYNSAAYLLHYWRADAFLDHRATRPWLVAAHVGNTLVGYLPLRLSTSRVFGLPFRKLEFWVTHDTDSRDVVADPSSEPLVADAIWSEVLRA